MWPHPSGASAAPFAALVFSFGGVKRLHLLFFSGDELSLLAPESRRPAELTLLWGAIPTSASDVGLGGFPEDAVDVIANVAVVDAVGGCYGNGTARRASRSAPRWPADSNVHTGTACELDCVASVQLLVKPLTYELRRPLFYSTTRRGGAPRRALWLYSVSWQKRVY